MKIALFGGSFNPIHNGHLQIANKLVEKKVVDQVWLLPCGNHAFNKQLESGKNRMDMICLAIKNNPSVKVVGVELNETKKSFSSETISWFKKEFNHDFFWVIGADNLKDLDKWHDFEYLKNSVEFILINRPGFEINNNLGIKIKEIVEMQSDISSTKIRENVATGKDLVGLVPEAVESFIKKEGLYK
ncbi:MAG: nicotinate (nicotinamide) nucleotide adenylyltransferase [archaeon]